MSRIISGAAGGTPLSSVPGSLTRPTTDRVKEALFSRLDAFGVIAGARVLDLYAGSGSLGVESGSRGAGSVDLVESEAKASAVCQRNADLINGVVGRKAVTVHRSKVEPFLDRAAESAAWDLVFLDPPYPLDEVALAAVLRKLAAHLAPSAVVVVERSSRSPEPEWPAELERFAEKKYGETRLWFAEPYVPDAIDSDDLPAAAES
ncbi:16S rRNA (guanine(966)-N(2))-methyltransferase RsmD [Pseudarthrobacter sp. SL88]|uniref:16S rRNA (guanine(966)-N(2))-methyltransferase RsmD n=1 Tax=Micrococcaceae TaxID=1268 RepID=UPI0006FA3053|nr:MULTISPECIES: 16S rRNA (guanine(966)-N(2))-methyltransferase RsmD [Micrococcaceae]KQQ80475.1 16S rRNA (guanine(966)-N(2))-methyltransferase RsmD [Arthrobacter sp. Leaf137]MCT9625095.1 16S rRNA (guanine(966)-N(2))-methyltransferase RsmD [Pseudarthrobacter equi]MCY1674453.1 16S rRNA (guanine(966)-N(2))-methyltransferase RsmD [Pseudarthrobacter sp. SL88]MDQ1055650.1 16S rRNA (guanine966-N2)-methyltransferase [Arthrobacter sp. SORGH_AS_0212]